MSESNELLAALQGLLAKSTAAPAATGWQQQPQPAPAAQVQGVAIPVKLSRGRGTIRLYFWLPAEAAANPQALNNALDELERLGIPLDVYEPRESGWGGNAGWNNSNRNWRR